MIRRDEGEISNCVIASTHLPSLLLHPRNEKNVVKQQHVGIDCLRGDFYKENSIASISTISTA